MARSVQQWGIYSTFTAAVIGIAVVLTMQLKLAIARYQSPKPQAILVLGGDDAREPAAAQLAAQQPNLKVWVSSGMLPVQANEIFLAENVSLSRVNLDYNATDTVTNFTTLITELQENNVRHVYLITSDFHMQRSKAIAFWILGIHGIAYTPVPVSSTQEQEPYHKIFRDVARSWLWLLTGRTGSSLDPDPPVKSS